jgi:hypothetical protein
MNKAKTQGIYFSRRFRVPDHVLQLNGRGILFVNNVRYIVVTFDRRMARRHHIRRAAAKALCKYVRTYFLSRSGRLSTNIKLTFYKALFRSVMTYACPAWEHVADAYLLTLQRLQNRVLIAIVNLYRRKPVRELHV